MIYSRKLLRYLRAVNLVAAVVTTVMLVDLFDGARTLVAPTSLVWVLALLILIGEAKPIRLSRGGEEYDEVTLSCTFALAAAMLGPLWLLLAAQIVAAAVDDVRRRKDLHRIFFNAGQLALTAIMTRAVYCLIAGVPFGGVSGRLDLRDVAAGLVAGVFFFAVNNGLTGTAVAFALDRPVLAHLRDDVRAQLSTSGVLLSFGPIFAVVGQFSLTLVPLLILPLAAVHRSADLAIQRERQALHDGLTGLPNRENLHQRLASALDHGRSMTGILLLDLDHFKEINDTLGHHIGDQLLCAVGARLGTLVREQDTVARLGGDEFAVLLPDIVAVEECTEVARRIQIALGESFVLDGVRLDVQSSIGIVVSPEHGSDSRELLRRADVALYAAKAERGSCQVYSELGDSHSLEKLALLGDLRTGIPAGQLVVHYQPKCDAVTGRPIGLEALVRWQHPTRGLLYPDSFLELAESTGLIAALTFEVLDRSLAMLATLRDAGQHVGMAVNMSVRVLADMALPGRVQALLDKHGLPAELLILEVTESSIMLDPARTMAVLAELRAMGLALSIDDFGTGYSSLSYLRRLKAQELKIDKSFVFSMARNSEDAVIVRSTIELGHNLGLRLVAEGVEDAETWHLLRSLGCDIIQGYHLARPMAGDALLTWLKDHHPVPAAR